MTRYSSSFLHCCSLVGGGLDGEDKAAAADDGVPETAESALAWIEVVNEVSLKCARRRGVGFGAPFVSLHLIMYELKSSRSWMEDLQVSLSMSNSIDQPFEHQSCTLALDEGPDLPCTCGFRRFSRRRLPVDLYGGTQSPARKAPCRQGAWRTSRK